LISSPISRQITAIVVERTKRINLNREEEPCVEDDDYNPVQCMEDWIAEKIGCKLPTDLFANSKVQQGL